MTAVLQTHSSLPRQQTPTPNVTQRFLLQNISWETYEALVVDLAEEHVFLAYANGTLELINLHFQNTIAGAMLARLIHTYTELREIPIAPSGEPHGAQEEFCWGPEADECFYIRNEASVGGRDDIDLSRDPAPDLAIDVTRYDLKKQDIYAALGIGELWRFENEKLVVRALTPDREYTQVSVSPNLPELPLEEVQRFMDLRHGIGETQWILTFRKWVQERFL